ncbi:MAG: DNA polymerase III subunit gamma/tau [Eubacteriales bacterium]|nr:DNA polymerase III subunit gamma/tau [Eubacteriales bacterium]
MSHQAIYRQYRPKTFDEVIGQQHITETIKNQIMRKSTAHAYLFSGIRGTGKTSTAKIFARAINCTNNTDGNPCNVCDSCLSILADRNMDVIEMDAASNNGVEDIRDLREKVRFLPSQSKFKVYIIDEVHMLSKGAFNALLKTLEEPPPHLLFLLATTEPQKIPATILSRCQRFDLRRIGVDDIIQSLKDILSDLGVKSEDEALRMIANSAEGAMRDAQSLLDRCLTHNNKMITYKDVTTLLGTVNYKTILEFTDALIKGDIRNTLILLDDILAEGKEISTFLEDLIAHLRNLLIVKSVKDSQKFIKLGEDAVQQLEVQSKTLSVQDNIRFIEDLSETLSLCKKAVNDRILLETRVIRLLSTSQMLKPEAFQKKETTVEIIAKNHKNESQATTEPKNDKKPHNQKNAELKLIKDQWENILAVIKKEKVTFNAVLKEAEPYNVEGDEVTVRFGEKFNFHFNRANNKENVELLQRIISSILKKNCTVKFVIDNGDEDSSSRVSKQQLKEELNQKTFDMFGEDKVEIIE